MRTFIAVDLDETIKNRLDELQMRLRKACPQVKWVDPHQMHLTLKFLGEITDQQAASVRQALDKLAAQSQRVDITVEELGTFPPAGGVSVVWVGIQDPTGRLVACQALCEQLVSPLGFPPENRRFSPHLTLARNKLPQNSRQIREALANEPPLHAGAQTVTGVTFYQSTLTPKGPIYKALSRHPFSD